MTSRRAEPWTSPARRRHRRDDPLRSRGTARSPPTPPARVGAGEASVHLNVIEFTADLIFSTITSASSVPCLPLEPYALGARPCLGRRVGAKVPGRLDATPALGFDVRLPPPARSLELHEKGRR